MKMVQMQSKYKLILPIKDSIIKIQIYPFFKDMELSFEKEKILWDYAKKFKKKIFSTPFDNESFNFFLENKVDAIKVASFETTNRNLLNSILKFKKTVFISTGLNKENEIQKFITFLVKTEIKFV